MIKRLYNIWFKRKTKNFTRIPVFVMTFDWNKFQKGGKGNSCMLYTWEDADEEASIVRRGRIARQCKSQAH